MIPHSHYRSLDFDMKTFIPFMLAVCLTIVFSYLTSENVYAQSDQAQKMDTATDGSSSYVTGITPGRARSLVGVALGLISLITGWRAKRRLAVSGSNVLTSTITALVLGSCAVILSVIHLTIVSGGFGTGRGKAGAIVALVLGLTGMSLGGFALLRSKQR
jgi:hypothetical protein